MVDVNLRCLDEDVRDRFQIVTFDDSHWETNVHQLHEDQQ
jgi:hypothetical protein